MGHFPYLLYEQCLQVSDWTPTDDISRVDGGGNGGYVGRGGREKIVFQIAKSRNGIKKKKKKTCN